MAEPLLTFHSNENSTILKNMMAFVFVKHAMSTSQLKHIVSAEKTNWLHFDLELISMIYWLVVVVHEIIKRCNFPVGKNFQSLKQVTALP